MCIKVHCPTQRSYTLATPPTSKQALYYSARLDVGGDVIMTLLLVGLCTLSTYTRCHLQVFAFSYRTNTRDFDSSARTFLQTLPRDAFCTT